jgi:hypothetical protein
MLPEIAPPNSNHIPDGTHLPGVDPVCHSRHDVGAAPSLVAGRPRRAPGGICAAGDPSVAFRGGTDLARATRTTGARMIDNGRRKRAVGGAT